MNKLKIITDLARQSGYNEQGKAAYKRLAMSVLRSIAKGLGLPKESYNIRFNAGGIAVAGEATLHHDRFYLQTSEAGVMFRHCTGQKDYTGGANQWAYFASGNYVETAMSVDQLVDKLRAMIARPIGGDNGGPWGPTNHNHEPCKAFDHLPDAYKCGH